VTGSLFPDEEIVFDEDHVMPEWHEFSEQTQEFSIPDIAAESPKEAEAHGLTGQPDSSHE
jgi:hypothetical protein